MRYTPAKTRLGLVALTTVIISSLFMMGTFGTGIQVRAAVPASPTQAVIPSAPTITSAADNRTSTTTTPLYPTTLSEQLSSVVISPRMGVAKGIVMGVGRGNAYGLVKQSLRASITMIQDIITVTSLQGTIPGTLDRIVLEAFYNGSSAPYCQVSTTFDPTGLTSYTTSLMCKYLGAGTYNFKVTVYDENGTVIGDPTTSMVL